VTPPDSQRSPLAFRNVLRNGDLRLSEPPDSLVPLAGLRGALTAWYLVDGVGDSQSAWAVQRGTRSVAGGAGGLRLELRLMEVGASVIFGQVLNLEKPPAGLVRFRAAARAVGRLSREPAALGAVLTGGGLPREGLAFSGDGVLSEDWSELVLEATWPGTPPLEGTRPPLRFEVEVPGRSHLELARLRLEWQQETAGGEDASRTDSPGGDVARRVDLLRQRVDDQRASLDRLHGELVVESERAVQDADAMMVRARTLGAKLRSLQVRMLRVERDRSQADADRLHELGDRQLKAVVLGWDLGHNPAGRAYMIAEALSRRFDVVLAGPLFPAFGGRLWPPIAGSSVPIVTFEGRDFPGFFHDLERLARRVEADVIVAVKPRLPSLELALLMKERLNRPLLLDVDDHELSFYPEQSPVPLSNLEAALSAPDAAKPYQATWTGVAESLTACADQVLVSNPSLHRRFGGLVVPHARDERTFDRRLYDRASERERFGLANTDRVVLFLGTVREHKGVQRLARAVLEIDDPAVKLCIVGDVPDAAVRQELDALGGDRVRRFPAQPFHDLARTIVVADLVVLLQDPASPVSRYQLPAKAVDAVAMGVPVLATRTEPLEDLIESGAVGATTEATLAGDVRHALALPADDPLRQANQRAVFEEGYSYRAIARTMESAILGLLRERPLPPLHPSGSALLGFHRELYGGPAEDEEPGGEASGLDLVVFWKQNDSALYGRRVDMLVKYLARSGRVRRIVLFDAPTEVTRLQEWASHPAGSHYRRSYELTLAKRWGLLDEERVRYATFVAAGHSRTNPLRIWPYPSSHEHVDFVRATLAEAGVDPSRSVALCYPRNFHLPRLIDELEPRLVVTDLVDDHRTWSDQTPKSIAEIETNYEEVLRRSDLAIANCEPIAERMAAWHQPIHLLPNACEYRPARSSEEWPRHPVLAGFTGPLVGYLGNLEADKIDFDLLRGCALARPGYDFVLVGSTHMNPAGLGRLDLPNVHLVGVVPYEELDEVVAAFDVAVLPHRVTEKTKAMHPLKTFVYLAHDVPVVATEVPNLGELAGHVRVVDDAEDFVTAIDEAIKRGKAPRSNELDALLRRNSWESRVAELLDLVEEHSSSKVSPR